MHLHVPTRVFPHTHPDARTKQVTGWIQKPELRAAVRAAFPNKSDAQSEELFDALDSDEPCELLNYQRSVRAALCTSIAALCPRCCPSLHPCAASAVLAAVSAGACVALPCCWSYVACFVQRL